MSFRTLCISSTILFTIVCITSPFLPAVLAKLISLAIVGLIATFAFRAIFATGKQRIFASGFLLSSIVYIITVFAVGDFTFREIGNRLPTTQFLHAFVQPPVSQPPVIQLVGPEARLRAAHGHFFIPLGHLLIAVAIGCCGAVYAQRLRRTAVVAMDTASGANAVA